MGRWRGVREVALGALDGAAGGEEVALGAVELRGDRGVRGVAVAVGDRDDALRELLDLGVQGAELGVSGSGGHRGQPAVNAKPEQFARDRIGPGYHPRAMLSRLDLRGRDADPRVALAAATQPADEPVELVRDIINDVRRRGDEAVRELTAKFDGCEIEDLRVPVAGAATKRSMRSSRRCAKRSSTQPHASVATTRRRARPRVLWRSLPTGLRSRSCCDRSTVPVCTCQEVGPRTRPRC